jgi:hypothetical protein
MCAFTILMSLSVHDIFDRDSHHQCYYLGIFRRELVVGVTTENTDRQPAAPKRIGQFHEDRSTHS